jgi:xanthosine utilization system XapX-like protein
MGGCPMLDTAYAQLIAGVAVGLFIWSLIMNTPVLRDLLAAVAAAGIADLLVGKHSTQDAGSIVDKVAAEISVHPYFTLGLMLAATIAATLFRVLRSQ